MNFTVNKVLTIPLFSLLLSACTNLQVNLAYVPESKQSPLSTITPVKFAIQIEDQRATGGERDLVGLDSGMDRSIGGDFKIRSVKEVATIFYDALKNELESNGHRVVDPKEALSDLVIHLGLKRYWSSVTIHLFNSDLVATIIADLGIRKPGKDYVLLSKRIEIEFVIYNHQLKRRAALVATTLTFFLPTPFHVAYVIKDDHEAVLNGALNEFIRRFARDPEVLKALEVAQQEKSEEAPVSRSGIGKKDTGAEPK